jgi:hypothetical protein
MIHKQVSDRFRAVKPSDIKVSAHKRYTFSIALSSIVNAYCPFSVLEKMYNLLPLMILLGSWDTALSNILPQITSPPQKRDGSMVTLNISAISNYQKTTVSHTTIKQSDNGMTYSIVIRTGFQRLPELLLSSTPRTRRTYLTTVSTFLWVQISKKTYRIQSSLSVRTLQIQNI